MAPVAVLLRAAGVTRRGASGRSTGSRMRTECKQPERTEQAAGALAAGSLGARGASSRATAQAAGSQLRTWHERSRANKPQRCFGSQQESQAGRSRQP